MKAVGSWLLDGLPYLAALAIGFGSAWAWQDSRSAAAIATIKAKVASDSRDRAEASARDLKSAIERGDRLYLERRKREAELANSLEKTRHELDLVTTDRPCLGAAAVRVLNNAQQSGMPHPLAVPFDGGAAAFAANPPDPEDSYASERDVADWVAIAYARYETCRERIADISAFDAGTVAVSPISTP